MRKNNFLCGLLLFALAVPAGLRAEYENLGPTEKQKMMEEHYSRALQSFNGGDYSQAINHWQEILKIDPDQSSPPELIRQAQDKLYEQIAPLEVALKEEVRAGRFESALAKAKEMTEKDPNNPKLKAYKTKLEAVSTLRPQETQNNRASFLVRRAVATHLFNEDNAKFAVNALRYARDLNPSHPGVAELTTYIENQYSAIAQKETITPGMSVVEHKLFIALNHIYEGRYDLAIFDCNEVLDLDPNNVLALKRKGSSYFALKQKDKARIIWKQALKVAPNDTEIKRFLAHQ